MNLQRVSFFLLFFLICGSLSAQFISATIGIDGLTCSACSYGTERSIRKLDFIESLKMDLNKNIAEITFLKNKDVSIDALVKKIYDAGFSVRFVEAVYHFSQPQPVSNHIFKTGTSNFYVLKSNSASLSGDVRMSFIKEKFVSRKEMSQWKDMLNSVRAQAGSSALPQYFVVIP